MPTTAQTLPTHRLRTKLRRLVLGLAIGASGLFAVAGVVSYAHPMEGYFRPHARVYVRAILSNGGARLIFFHEWESLAPYPGCDAETMAAAGSEMWRSSDGMQFFRINIFCAQNGGLQHVGYTFVDFHLAGFAPIAVIVLLHIGCAIWRRCRTRVAPFWREVWKPDPPVRSLMRRLRRIVMGILSVAALSLLCVITVGRAVSVVWPTGSVPVTHLHVGGGAVSGTVASGPFYEDKLILGLNRNGILMQSSRHLPRAVPVSSQQRRILGFYWEKRSHRYGRVPEWTPTDLLTPELRAYLRSTTQIDWHLEIPMWAVWPLLLGPVLLAFIRGPMRRCRRRARGLCVVCGYNLTGLPEPRCPECGHRASDIASSTNDFSKGD